MCVFFACACASAHPRTRCRNFLLIQTTTNIFLLSPPREGAQPPKEGTRLCEGAPWMVVRGLLRSWRTVARSTTACTVKGQARVEAQAPCQPSGARHMSCRQLSAPKSRPSVFVTSPGEATARASTRPPAPHHSPRQRSWSSSPAVPVPFANGGTDPSAPSGHRAGGSIRAGHQDSLPNASVAQARNSRRLTRTREDGSTPLPSKCRRAVPQRLTPPI